MSYRDDWADARAEVKAAGAPVVLTAPGQANIAGYAMAVRGDARVYEAMKLTEAQPQTLLFVPTTYGVLPSLLPYGLTWAGQAFVVKGITQVAPDGNCVMARLVVIR